MYIYQYSIRAQDMMIEALILYISLSTFERVDTANVVKSILAPLLSDQLKEKQDVLDVRTAGCLYL